MHHNFSPITYCFIFMIFPNVFLKVNIITFKHFEKVFVWLEVWSTHTYPSFCIALLSSPVSRIIVLPWEKYYIAQSHKCDKTALAILFMLKSEKPVCKGLHIACTTRWPSTLQACDLVSFPHPNILVCPIPPSPTIPQSSWWALVSQLPWDAQLLRGRRDGCFKKCTVFLLLLPFDVQYPHGL